MTELTVVNLDTAKFECTFGRGCEGICCRNGRPSVSAEEQATIERLLPRILPRLRPKARQLVEKEGVLSNRKKLDQPMLRVQDSWCVLFNQGCVLHHLGAEDGSSYQYKPVQCALFPLEPHSDGRYYVRQWGYEKERWDLFCLNPNQSPVAAAESLSAEIAYAQQWEERQQIAKNNAAE